MEPRAALLSLLCGIGTGDTDLVIDEALVRMVDHIIPARALKVGCGNRENKSRML